MVTVFEDRGIRFRYPANWQLEQEETADGWTVTLQSPDTAFVMIFVREDRPTPHELVTNALEALRQEYSSLEADEVVETLAGQPAIGHDMRFFSFDLTNTCWTRSLQSPAGTLLIMCQANDLELENHEPVMRAICASLEV